MLQQVAQAIERVGCRLDGIVRMDSDRSVEERIAFRQSDSRLQILRSVTGADRHQILHSRRPRPFDDGHSISGELLVVQMAVGIDQPHFNRAPTGASSRKPASIGFPPSSEAATIIPLDVMPRSLRGCKFATMTTFLPSNCCGVYASAMPATIVRGSGSPMSILRW